MIYQANEEYNKFIPSARGEADRTIREAEGVRPEPGQPRQGRCRPRFRDTYEEYRKAKDVTKRRLYLEQMRSVLQKMGPNYIGGPRSKAALPLLNLIDPAGK